MSFSFFAAFYSSFYDVFDLFLSDKLIKIIGSAMLLQRYKFIRIDFFDLHVNFEIDKFLLGYFDLFFRFFG